MHIAGTFGFATQNGRFRNKKQSLVQLSHVKLLVEINETSQE
jgi:hypothetical protein